MISMSADVHRIEVHDIDNVSRRVKMDLLHLRTEGPLGQLERKVRDMRKEILSDKHYVKANRDRTTLKNNLKSKNK